MKKNLFFLLLILFCSPLFAQENAADEYAELLIEGQYTGYNLYVLNPATTNNFCVQKVMVNGKTYTFANESNAFEINLKQFPVGDMVVVQVLHTPDCQPRIINKDKLKKVTEFHLPSFIYNKKTKLLTWKISEMKEDCDYDLEQLLYGKWVKIKNLGTPADMLSDNYLPVLLSGMNYFRIKQKNNNGQELLSPVVNIKSPNRRILLLTDKVKNAVEFTDVTHYELYDENGYFIKRGTAKKIDISNLAKGIYWLNFDGKEIRITKK